MTDYEREFCTRCDNYRGYICAEHRKPSYEQLEQRLAAAEALLREAVENVTTVGLNGMHTSVLPSWLKRAKEVCGDN